ncbi:E3 ubiquitin-protein ligase XIAP isoform X3 [Ahaetulla prasina]|uniref:E3 ubiquitin-protein ligase XIAP isoform X3 n=1 Tax=Ahaetulla prasina TaxID=499056 RepID=UPI0026472DD2|nr:E3 ubiquitin-protein ligase XIAP isoform X3 [Ahaetulla prasina]
MSDRRVVQIPPPPAVLQANSADRRFDRSNLSRLKVDSAFCPSEEIRRKLPSTRGMTCNGPIVEDPAPDLAQLTSRQETFAGFPSGCPVSSSDLARAGFFYTGEGDQVRCFSCLATLEGWEAGDSVVGRHKDVSPNCCFINDANFEDGRLLSGLPNGPPEREAAAATTTSVPPDSDLSSDFEADYLLRTRQVVDLSGSPYPQNPAMCNEEVRLRSFHHWPPYAPVTPEDLANAGLYYRGVEDEVECFCCGGKLKNWEPGDQAWSEHRRHFPRCFFVLGHDVGNVENVAHQPGDGQLDRSSTHRVPPLPPPPHNPSMADFAKRLQTFGVWSYSVSKERLAQAGFYSLGIADSVECFSCGGGLKEWKAGEDPWEEHARWYPGCKYLGEEKGQAFVNSVHLKSLPPESTTEEAEKVLTIEDEEHLQSRAIQSALQMGFSMEEISQMVERKARLSAERYRSVEALVTDLIGAQRDDTPSAHLENHLQKDLSTEEKLKRLEEEKICKICMDKLLSVVFIPCGHLACQECAEAVEKCPWCCKFIANRQKVFMP